MIAYPRRYQCLGNFVDLTTKYFRSCYFSKKILWRNSFSFHWNRFSTSTAEKQTVQATTSIWTRLGEQLASYHEALRSALRSDHATDTKQLANRLKLTSPFVSLMQERLRLDQDIQAVYTLLEENRENQESTILLKIEADNLQQQLEDNEERISDSCWELLEQKQEPYLHQVDETLMEIRSAAGGEESALFVKDLWSLYEKYCMKKNWTVELLEVSKTEQDGYREVIAMIKSKDAYDFLRREAGVHRVQRIPQTESSGRIHSSTVSVVILPGQLAVAATSGVGEETSAQRQILDESQLKFEYFRAGGAGGQHVNKTESAVRVRHIPSGIVATCQEERSQLANKKRAVSVLAARLAARNREEKRLQLSAKRKQQTHGGERNERIRTYNFLQSRVTDHRSGFSLHGASFEDLLNGGYALEEIVQSVGEYDRKQMLEHITNVADPIEFFFD